MGKSLSCSFDCVRASSDASSVTSTSAPCSASHLETAIPPPNRPRPTTVTFLPASEMVVLVSRMAGMVMGRSEEGNVRLKRKTKNVKEVGLGGSSELIAQKSGEN